jgi:hypothetical protein
MINRSKLVAIVALAAASLAAAPALAQSFDPQEGTGNQLPFAYQADGSEAGSHYANAGATRRTGMDSFAMEPRAHSRVPAYADPNSPALTGGGSLGYNRNIYNDDGE